jgi:hypothetical protein
MKFSALRHVSLLTIKCLQRLMGKACIKYGVSYKKLNQHSAMKQTNFFYEEIIALFICLCQLNYWELLNKYHEKVILL